MKNKWFSLLALLVVISMILVACGTTETPEPVDEPEVEAVVEPTEVAVEEPEETEEVIEEPLGEPLKIGVLADLTGGLALFGNEMWEGAQIGFDYATDGTMMLGNRPVELIIRDTTGNVEAGTAAARELIEAEGVEVLMGVVSSGIALQVQQIADENGVVFFAAPAASPAITGENFNEHTFRVCRNAAQDSTVLADWAIENVGTNYLILAEDYAFGQATAAGFEFAFGAKGATFIDDIIYAPSDTNDFTPYIQQILAEEPDGLILVWATNTSAQILFDQLTNQGVTGNIPFVTGYSSNDLVRFLDPGLVGAVGYRVYDYALVDTPANDYLTAQYLELYEGYPDLFSECGFATAQAIIAGLELTAGESEAQGLIAALEGLVFEGPKGTYTIRAEDHQALAPQQIVRLLSVDDPKDIFFELVALTSAEDSAPPCTAPGRCD